ncbi:hypothetical protein BLGI_4470 [Brevibacillus laterosporus GI-9]|nr:hypothetical protein BLGI_4470 [Brevibacillus laterosporus GI-9]
MVLQFGWVLNEKIPLRIQWSDLHRIDIRNNSTFRKGE